MATPRPTCSWFARCDRPSDGVVDHPILGEVPTCQRCADRMEQTLKPYPSSEPFDEELLKDLRDDINLEHGTCTTCLTAITEVDGIWYHDRGDDHGLAPHLARPQR